MPYLTLRARRLIDEAMRLPENAVDVLDWSSWQRDHPPSAAPVDLAPAMARIVTSALQRLSQYLLRAIEGGAGDEDNLADLANDLSFVDAIKRDLTTTPNGRVA